MPAITLPDIQAPVRAPLRGGILDAATVRDNAALGFLRQGAGYESWACALTMIPKLGADCVFTPQADKAFTAGPSFAKPNPFVVYATALCKAVGGGWLDIDDRIRDAYLMKESYAVELALLELWSAAGAGATVIPMATPPNSIVVAIGELEQYAADKYSAAPTLHIPAFFSAQLSREGVLHKEGDVWHTQLGSKVSLGGGYGYNGLTHIGPGGAAPAAGAAWIYATGEVEIDRGELNANKAINTKNNDMSVLTERAYVATWDCLLIATQASLVPASLATVTTVVEGGG